MSPSALPVGVHDLVVMNPDGESATLAGGFTVVAMEMEEEEGTKESSGCSNLPLSSWSAGILISLALLRRRRTEG